MLEIVIVAALASSFALSTLDYWVRSYPRFLRVLASVAASLAACAALGARSWALVVAAAAGAFLAVSVVSLMERALSRTTRSR